MDVEGVVTFEVLAMKFKKNMVGEQRGSGMGIVRYF